MPTYEYQCEVCDKVEEVWQKMDDPAPECHEKPMKRLIAGVPWIRKGAGLFSHDGSNKRGSLGDL